jgi:hypothetical protein
MLLKEIIVENIPNLRKNINNYIYKKIKVLYEGYS